MYATNGTHDMCIRFNQIHGLFFEVSFFFSSRKNANDSNTEKQKHKQRREEMVSEDESSVQHTSHGALSDS